MVKLFFNDTNVDDYQSSTSDRYRKSFPGASNSITSSGYFSDVSTTEDTDGSGGFSSPKQQHSTHKPNYISTAVRYSSFCPASVASLGEPRYQFRKSNSMKLALKEDEEGEIRAEFSFGCCRHFEFSDLP